VSHRRAWLIAGATLALMLAPIAIHLFLSDTGDRSSQASILTIDAREGTLHLFSQFYRSYFTDSFLFQHGDNTSILRHYLPGQGELYWWQLPVILVGVVALACRLNRRYVFVLTLLVVFPLGGALSDSSPISTRAILGAVAFSLLTGAGLGSIVDTLKAQIRNQMLAVVAPLAFVAVIATAMFASYMSRYFSEYPAEAAGYWGWQDGAEQIIQHFQRVEGDYDELVMDGNFNAPGIFIRFYAGDHDCQKCVIGAYERYDPQKNQLFALRPETLSKSGLGYDVLDVLRYEDGTIAFEFVEFTGAASGDAPRPIR
jgi:hypothetical protein